MALIDMSRPFDAEAKAAIDEFYKQVLTISPCTKDICRLRVGRWLYAEMPMAIMHDSYKNLYKKFTDKHPQFALVVSKTTFKKNAPFFLRKVKRQSCLCETCENSAMLLKTLKKAADDIEKLFKERVILESANGPGASDSEGVGGVNGDGQFARGQSAHVHRNGRRWQRAHRCQPHAVVRARYLLRDCSSEVRQH